MHRLILDNQAISALKGGGKVPPAQQQHVHYSHPAHDKRFVSDNTENLLREMMRLAGIGDIWITSTVRDEREQASVMLDNLEAEKARKAQLASETDPIKRTALDLLIKKNHVGYARPGSTVLKAAEASLADIDDRETTIDKMIKSIHKVGLSKVTKHAAVSGKNTVDISAKRIIAKYGKKSYALFISTIVSYVNQGRVARFGWPDGPKGSGRLFHDGGCLHVEIDQASPVDKLESA